MAAASGSGTNPMAGAASWPPALKAFVTQTFAQVSCRRTLMRRDGEAEADPTPQCTDANREKVEAELKKVCL